ncbi:MAG TPA: CHAD domain-containing protein [Candidatus Aphodovivens avistercoris]|nr:CHAD domain-containing protein [Candidatus Aphodovivens avistercoris]
MAKTLVLMRHGKAQTRREGLPDFDRPLTRAGRRTLQATLPSSLGLWPRKTPCAIWTSPALRTTQTADCLAAALKARGTRVTGIEERTCLLDQDLPSFLREFADADVECVAVVGHNPFIEELCALLTGANVHFSPGALAAIQLPEAEAEPALGDEAAAHTSREPMPRDSANDAADAMPASASETKDGLASSHEFNLETVSQAAALAGARLLWFVQGAACGPWRTLVELEDVVKAAHAQMEARLQDFLRDPDEVETLHKLRVSIRTLRSLHRFLRPFHRAAAAREVQRDLRTLVLPTSRLRELDVLIDEASQMEPPATDLVAACRALREQERDRVLAALTSPKASAALTGASKAARKYRWKRSVERNGLREAQVAARFAQMEHELDQQLQRTDLADAEATHDVRKAAKRVRYAAERFGSFVGEERAARASARMKGVQDNLGALCDARVNVAIVEGFPRAGLSESALRDLAALDAKSRYFIATKLRSAGA